MKKNTATALLAFGGMLALILDSKTTLLGASQGITLCIRTLIPTLFPFFVLSTLLTSSLTGLKLPFGGDGAYFLIGLLGGYPVGAKSIADSGARGGLSKEKAGRMIAFCNNAGPAFLFGIGMQLFENLWICLLLWGIHILSAGMVAILTPADKTKGSRISISNPISLTEAVQASLKTMALVCGWVVLFRVLLSILSRWCLWMLPKLGISIVFGLLELSNGILYLSEIPSVGLRFTLFSAYLAFGGLCVALQTCSLIGGSGISFRRYLPGKLTQTAISLLLSALCQFAFPPEHRFLPAPVTIVIVLLICLCYRISWKKSKNSVDFDRRLLYNQEKKARSS